MRGDDPVNRRNATLFMNFPETSGADLGCFGRPHPAPEAFDQKTAPGSAS